MKIQNIFFLMIITLILSGCGTSASVSEADNVTITNNILPSGNISLAGVETDDGSLVVSQVEHHFHKPVYQFLSDTGNTSGNYTATGDYSVTSKFFYIQPNSTQIISLTRVLIHYTDTGTFDANNYGNGISISNGMKAIAKINNVTYDMFGSEPVRTNSDWGAYCFDVDYLSYGVGDNTQNVRCTFTKGGQDFILNGSNGDYFGFNLSDSYTGLTHQHFHTQGKVISEDIY